MDNDFDGLIDEGFPNNDADGDADCVDVDDDNDSITDGSDNCQFAANTSQRDTDSDSMGDACDPDDDNDTILDASPDNCPVVANPGQENIDSDAWGDACDECPTIPTPWIVPPLDIDCDGFSAARETFMGTDVNDHCSATPEQFDETIDAWPTDMDDNRWTQLSDVVLFGPHFNKISPDLDYSPRFDLNANNRVNLSDVVLLGPFYNRTCVP